MQDKFDNNIGDNGENTTPFIPFETAWANLKPELDKEEERRKKKKRRFIIFWFLFAGVLLGSGIFFYYNNFANHSALTVTNKQENRLVNKIAINQQRENANANEQSTVIVNTDKPSVSSGSMNENIQGENSSTENSKAAIVNHDNKLLSISNKAISKKQNTNSTVQHNNFSNDLNAGVSVHKPVKNKYIDIKNTKGVTSNQLTHPADIQKGRKSNVVVAKPLMEKTESNKNNSIIDQPTDKNANIYTKENIEKSSRVIANDLSANSASEVSAANNVKQIDSAVKKLDSANKTIVKNKAEPKTFNPSKSKSFSYGIQFNVPFGDGVNSKDVNANNKPFNLLIPQIWVSKQLGQKHFLSLHLNPYAQYYVNNKVVLDSSHYDVTIVQGNRINNGPELIKYAEYTAVNKVISIEATLLYQYQVSCAFKIGVGISNCWTQGVLMQHKVIKNNSITTTDNLYGVDKNSTEWNLMNANFMLGKLEALYKLRKLAVGLNISTPIKDLFAQKVNNVPTTNTNIFIRWAIR